MYSYQTQRAHIFTEDGNRMLLEIRDKALRLIAEAGAVQMSKLFVSGDTWDSMACVAGQHRVYVKGRQ